MSIPLRRQQRLPRSASPPSLLPATEPLPAVLQSRFSAIAGPEPWPAIQARQWLPWHWHWPLPAVAAWCAAWLSWRLAAAWGLPAGGALALASLVGVLMSWPSQGVWRRWLGGLGFPAAALVSGWTQDLSPWWWLLPLLPLSLAYPLRAWRDAPLFPTPVHGLRGLPDIVGQPTRLLDAGCGLGHGLRELSALWPSAALHGIEWSPLLAWAASWRVKHARIERGDMWLQSWAGFDLVYLFQRPETMARAWAKARRELKPGAWLVSLEFPVAEVPATARLAGPGRRTVWIYRLTAASSDSTVCGPGR